MYIKVIFRILIFCHFSFSFSQSFSNSSPILDKSLFSNGDKISRDNIIIKLYDINLDGISLPIFLSYDNSGIRVSDVPSSVGMNWKLHAGGMIEREVKGIPDEYKDVSYLNPEPSDTIRGLFHDTLKLTDFEGVYDLGDAIQGHNLSNYHDSSSDIYSMNISNGDYSTFMFNQLQTGTPSQTSQYQFETVYLERNQNYLLDVNFSDLIDRECLNCEDFKLTSDNGLEYIFSKGPKNEVPFLYFSNRDLNGPLSERNYYSHNDFYLKEINSKYNSDVITFDYLDLPTSLSREKLIANIRASGTDIHNGEEYASIGSDYWEDILITEENRFEIEEINTLKERIVFEYENFQYIVSSGQIYGEQDIFSNLHTIKLLKRILIYDHNENITGGFNFSYVINQGADGKPFLDEIEKIGSDGVSKELYRGFEYYDPSSLVSSLSSSQDILGYSNHAPTNAVFDNEGYRNITTLGYKYEDIPPGGQPIPVLVEASDRSPDLLALKSGMLKAIKNKFNGKTEFDYKINQDSNLYYGGVLVEYIKKYDENGGLIYNKKYEYFDGNGFSIPLTSDPNQQCQYSPKDFFRNDIENNPQAMGTIFNYSSFPIELFDTESILCQSNPINPLDDYQKVGNFYERVIEKQFNVNEVNEVSNGYILNYYRPNFGYNLRNSRLYKTEIYDVNNDLVELHEFDYTQHILKTFSVIEYDNNHENNGTCNIGGQGIVNDPLYGEICVIGHHYKLEKEDVNSIDYLLNEKRITKFNNDGSSSNSRITYEYLSNNNIFDKTKVKKLKNYFNNEAEPFKEKHYLYLNELTNIPNSFNSLLEYSNPLVQTTEWDIDNNNNHILKAAAVNEFYDDGKLKNIYAISKKDNNQLYNILDYTNPYYDSNDDFITVADIFSSFNYFPTTGKLFSEINHQSLNNVYYQRTTDYDEAYVDAMMYFSGLINVQNITFVRRSFENPNEQGVVFFEEAVSGDYVYSNTTLNLGNYPSNYLISWWEYKNGYWVYKQSLHNGGNVQISLSAGATYIDEVRVHPFDASMTSATFKPLIGKQSTISNSGTIIKNHFDVFSRLKFITDENNNLIKEINTNFLND